MDRRSLLFILIVTLSFFGIRTWYEKHHEAKLEEWKKQYGEHAAVDQISSKVERKPHLSSPALFDLSLVYAPLSQEESPSHPVLLSSQLIEEVSDEVNAKKAFGFSMGDGLYTLISSDEYMSWPNAIPLSLLKTRKPVSAKEQPRLVKAFSNSFAIYELPSARDAVQKRRPHIAASASFQQAEAAGYCVQLIGKDSSDPESYAVRPIYVKNGTYVDDKGAPLSLSNSLLFTYNPRDQRQFLPLGVISEEEATSKKKVFTTRFFDKEPAVLLHTEVAPDIYTASLQPLEQSTEYYVLENGYQQIVFSTKNAAIVEINLPFTSDTNSKSVVRPIAFDRTMVEVSPNNARFPLSSRVRTASGEIVEQRQGGFYPLLRRSLMSDDSNTVIAKVLPKYQSCALTSRTASKEDSLQFRMTHMTDSSIRFEGRDAQGRRIVKTYSFPKESDKYPYCIDVDFSIEGSAKGADFLLTTGVPEIEWMSGASSSSLGYLRENGGGQSRILERIDLPKDRFFSKLSAPDWILNANGFFAFIMKPIQGEVSGLSFEKASGSDAPSRLVELDNTGYRFTEEELPGYQAGIGVSANKQYTIRLFAGPLDDEILHTIDTSSEKEYGSSFDFSRSLTYQGWFTFVSEPFARLLYFFMKQFHRIVGSWALSIVFATVILRILLYPLNAWSMKSMRKMQEISPLIKAIQERHKKDPAKAQMEMMALYREKGVNPFSGCLPLLIQMPFLIGMFDLLKSTFALRGASFIPGWIPDLSAPDVLFHFPFRLPILGNEFHALPVILGGIMWLQQSMSSKLPKDPAEWTEQQRQQRATALIMTVVMTIMFYNFPSGLNIYWISSMLLGILQQWWTVNRPIHHGAAQSR